MIVIFFIILILDERKKLFRLQEQNNSCYIYVSPIMAYEDCFLAISSLSWRFYNKAFEWNKCFQ